MSRNISWGVFNVICVGILILTAFNVSPAWGQAGSTGTVTVNVADQSGAVVPGAQLQLQDLSTNDIRKADTLEGTYSFVNLPIGTYELKISKAGFETRVYDTVTVQAGRVTDISVTLNVSAQTVRVEVGESATPLVESTTNAVGTTIDTKQMEELPTQGRDVTQLANLVPGYNGTWNGLPAIAQGNNIDGIISSTGRMKFSGNSEPVVTPRLENMQEFTVQTDQLDLDQGFGQSNMQINFVTRRGGNAFHGGVFEDFRNSALNANSWINDASGLPKNHFIENEFGGSLGGPIIKNKLFFFSTYAETKIPGAINGFNWVLTPAAQAGTFTYTGTDQQSHTVDLLQLAGNLGFPSTINSVTASTLQAINSSLQYGSVTGLGDPNLAELHWASPSPYTYYFPAVRVDYNTSDALRFNFAWNETKQNQPGIEYPNFPGPQFSSTGAGNKFLFYTLAFGFNWTISPTLINEFHGGFLYNYDDFMYNTKPTWLTEPQVSWNFPNLPTAYQGQESYGLSTQLSGTYFLIPTGSYYPTFSLSDAVMWQHGTHGVKFGFSWWREQDHYYNPVEGFPLINLGASSGTGLAAGDPAQAAFTTTGPGATLPNATSTQQAEAETLYAVLTGRIASVTGQYPYDPHSGAYSHQIGAFNLDELQGAWGLFFQDSYRMKPNLTVNYGLRWDFTGADRDLSGAYHSASPVGIYGPSGINNLFNPGSLKGDMNPVLAANPHPYNDWNVAPQPAIGISWNPKAGDGFLGRAMGGDASVIRAAFSLRKFTEPQQYVWNQASDYGAFYYQGYYLNPNNTGLPGTFSPGSLFLGNSLPPYGFAPQTYQKSEPEADFAFLGTNVPLASTPGVNGVNPHLQQPYTESWTLGVQRQLGQNQALEIRYVGSLTPRQWIAVDPNEVNVFENGFLAQFKAAQNNLAINNANGFSGSFANNGLPGQVALPIFDAAFAGEPSGGSGAPFLDYINTSFVNDLNTGQVGAMAGVLANINGAAPYFCNLVGSSFSPCLTNAGYAGAGAGYPINFFQANPFSPGLQASYLVAEATTNYNALQVDFRQRAWHGLQFDANYTWSHTLGISTFNSWQGGANVFTLRNSKLGYGPALFDIRHAVNVNGTYDLPLGRGKAFLNRGGIVDRAVGGWTFGSIFTFQTGAPFLLQGGNLTYNDYADGGVILNGVTRSQIQSAVGVYRVPGQAYVDFLNPKYLLPGGGANPQYISPNTTPGTIGQLVYLYGPHYINDDVAITKTTAIRENIRFRFQVELLNAFNHPNFQPGAANGCLYACFANGFSPNVQSGVFATGATSPIYPLNAPNLGARQIELRANIDF